MPLHPTLINLELLLKKIFIIFYPHVSYSCSSSVLAAPGWGCSQVSVAAEMIRLSQSRCFPWRRHLSRCACANIFIITRGNSIWRLWTGPHSRRWPSGSDLTECREAANRYAWWLGILITLPVWHQDHSVWPKTETQAHCYSDRWQKDSRSEILCLAWPCEPCPHIPSVPGCCQVLLNWSMWPSLLQSLNSGCTMIRLAKFTIILWKWSGCSHWNPINIKKGRLEFLDWSMSSLFMFMLNEHIVVLTERNIIVFPGVIKS